MTLMYSGKVEKKFGSKIGGTHYSPHSTASPHRTKSNSSLTGTNLSIEIAEVREIQEKKSLVGGPYLCVLEVSDPSIQQTVWKQKSSAQFTNKPPIIFGDVFKVKNFTGDFGVDIKPGFSLKVQFCKITDKSPQEIDSANIQLEDLIVNKEQQKIVPLEKGKAEIVLRMTLSNTQYPRGNTLTLNEITQKEKEKEKHIEQEKIVEPDKTLNRTNSVYSLPRLNVRFSIHYHTVPGEELRIVGSNYKLGDWDASKAPVMEWTHDGVWVLEVNFRKAFVPFEYKFVLMKDGNARWENIPGNRKVEATEAEFLQVSETWEKP